jgi:hypothetical protein
MLYLSKYNLCRRSSINILQDIQKLPNHSNRRLNAKRKFQSADNTGYVNHQLLNVNFINLFFKIIIYYLSADFILAEG